MARKATGKKSSRSTTKSKSARSRKSTTRSTARRATARPKTAARAAGRSGAGRSGAGRSGAGRSGAARSAKGDFGIPARKQKIALAASEETKNRPAGSRRNDPRQPRSGVESREAGVGMRDAGPGSDSGGDLDAQVVGLEDNTGLAQSGPDDESSIGAAETDGSSDEFASGPRARGENQGDSAPFNR